MYFSIKPSIPQETCTHKVQIHVIRIYSYTRFISFPVIIRRHRIMSSPKPLTLDPALFDPSAISEETKVFSGKLIELTAKTPKFWDVGAAEMRRMRKAGELHRPAPALLDTATNIPVPSREEGRTIPCRLLKPQNGKPVRAVFLHIHGGGWVLGDHEGSDPRLQEMADDHGFVCLSVGYRLAPEHPFPAGPEDCYDVAEWLVLNAQAKYGAPLSFVGGDSAGGHLSMLVALHLLQHKDARFSDFRFKGLLLYFGCFDMNFTPSVKNVANTHPGLLLDYDSCTHFREAFLPGYTEEERKRPDISPLNADLERLRGKLPPALFICGTRDCLIDDTLFMSVRWLAAGGEAKVEIVPGVEHGFINFPRNVAGCGAEQGMAVVDKFITEKL